MAEVGSRHVNSQAPMASLESFRDDGRKRTFDKSELRSKVVEVVKVVFMLAAFNITSYINGRAGKDPIRLSNYKHMAIDGT
ncbi:hypothetical protein MMC29_006952 [Sticta canariensis]|nr:hypothetical protein [Sticta canariensis]